MPSILRWFGAVSAIAITVICWVYSLKIPLEEGSKPVAIARSQDSEVQKQNLIIDNLINLEKRILVLETALKNGGMSRKVTKSKSENEVLKPTKSKLTPTKSTPRKLPLLTINNYLPSSTIKSTTNIHFPPLGIFIGGCEQSTAIVELARELVNAHGYRVVFCFQHFSLLFIGIDSA